MALDEIELLNDIRKNSFLTKIQKSGFKIPIAVIALLLAGFLLFLSFSVLLFADVDEETVIPADFYLSYTITEMYVDDEIEIIYAVSEDININIYIHDRSNYEKWIHDEAFEAQLQHSGSSDTINYKLIKDGDLYITFVNPSDNSVTVDVRIEDKTLTLYGLICYLPLAIILVIFSILVLRVKNDKIKVDEKTESSDYYPRPPGY